MSLHSLILIPFIEDVWKGIMEHDSLMTEADQGLSNRGGAKYTVDTAHISEAWRAKSLRPESWCPLEGPGSSRVSDAPSCYLVLYFEADWYKIGYKHTPAARPSGSAPHFPFAREMRTFRKWGLPPFLSACQLINPTTFFKKYWERP